MSYSFTVKAASKATALAAFVAKLDETVIGPQPIHQRDRAAILANAEATINLLADDDSKDVTVSCSGYLSWTGTGQFTNETAPIGTAAIASHASLMSREV